MIRRFLRYVIHFIYRHIAKPLLFRNKPDAVHNATIKFAALFGNVFILRWLTALIFRRRPDNRLIQTYHDVKFNNPVGLAAGFDKNGEIVPTIAALGFGFETVGSVTAKPCAGNPRPWFYRLPKTKSTVVNAGLGNDGSSAVIKRLKKYSQRIIAGSPIVLSIAKTNSRQVVSISDGINDYVATLQCAKNIVAIQAVELNISCPNTYGGEPFTTTSSLENLLVAVKGVGIMKPIFIKMTIDLPWSKFKQLLDVAVKHGIAGVTIANLMKDRTKVDLKDELPDTIKGNLSGKATWDDSNELIRRTYLEYGDKLTIIGVGGIFSAEDAYTKIRLGASLVELITGMLFTGPQLAAEINDGLVRLMKRDGFDHISQVIGIDSKK